MKAVKDMADGGMMDPNASLQREKQRSKRGPLDKSKAKNQKKQQRKNANKQRKKNRR